MKERQSAQPISTLQVECPCWSVMEQRKERSRVRIMNCQRSALGVAERFDNVFGAYPKPEYQYEPQSEIDEYTKMGLPSVPPPRSFTLTIAIQPDGTVITRAFCVRNYDYCKRCPYGQGVWIDHPKVKD